VNKYLTKMIFEMDLRGLTENTKNSYLNSMKHLIKYHCKSPELLDIEDVKTFLVNKRKYNGDKLSNNTLNRYNSGFRFFYQIVLNRKDFSEQLPKVKRESKIPLFFTQDEIKKMINVLTNIKFKAIFMTLYSTGMRLSEIQNLKATDIDSKRMVINIRNGKGGKDRQALLSPHLLSVLRTYWKINEDDKSKFLFAPSINTFDPTNLSKKLSHTAIAYVLKTAANAAGIKKKSIPTL